MLCNECSMSMSAAITQGLECSSSTCERARLLIAALDIRCPCRLAGA